MRRDNANLNNRLSHNQERKNRIESSKKSNGHEIDLESHLNKMPLEKLKRSSDKVYWDLSSGKKNPKYERENLASDVSQDGNLSSRHHDLEALKSDREAKWRKTDKKKRRLSIQEFNLIDKEIIYEKEVDGVMKVYRKRVIPKKFIKNEHHQEEEEEEIQPEELNSIPYMDLRNQNNSSQVNKKTNRSQSVQQKTGRNSISSVGEYPRLSRKKLNEGNESKKKLKKKEPSQRKNNRESTLPNPLISNTGINLTKPKNQYKNPFKILDYNLSEHFSPRKNQKNSPKKLPYIRTESSILFKELKIKKKVKNPKGKGISVSQSESNIPSMKNSYFSTPNKVKKKKFPKISQKNNQTSKDIKIDVIPSSSQTVKNQEKRVKVVVTKHPNKVVENNQLSKNNNFSQSNPSFKKPVTNKNKRKNISVFQKRPPGNKVNLELKHNAFEQGNSLPKKTENKVKKINSRTQRPIIKKNENRNLKSRFSKKKSNDKKVKFSGLKNKKEPPIKRRVEEGLLNDDGDDPILNRNPDDLNHPSTTREEDLKPYLKLQNIPNFFIDDPMNFIPKTKGGKRDDLSVTNQSFYSNLGRKFTEENKPLEIDNSEKLKSETSILELKKEEIPEKNNKEKIEYLVPKFKVIREEKEEYLEIEDKDNVFSKYNPIMKKVKNIAEKMVNLLNLKKPNPFDLAIQKHSGNNKKKRGKYGGRGGVNVNRSRNQSVKSKSRKGRNGGGGSLKKSSKMNRNNSRVKSKSVKRGRR